MTGLRPLASSLTLALCLSAGAARADCSEGATATVQLSMDPALGADEFRAAVARELRVALRDRDLAMCESAAPAPIPVAIATLRLYRDDAGQVVIEIEDAVTRKRMRRTLRLAGLPEDSHALATAVAADELLRASWMELALADAPPPAQPPPPQVTQVVEDAVQREREPRTTAGARAALEHFGAGELLLGADVFLARRFSERWGLEISAGARRGQARGAQHGSVRSLSLGGGLAVLCYVLDRPRGVLLVAAEARGAQVGLEGTPQAPHQGGDAAGIALIARGGLRASFKLHRHLRLQLDGGGGAAVLGVVATDAGRDVTGVAGYQLHAQLGLGGQF